MNDYASPDEIRGNGRPLIESKTVCSPFARRKIATAIGAFRRPPAALQSHTLLPVPPGSHHDIGQNPQLLPDHSSEYRTCILSR